MFFQSDPRPCDLIRCIRSNFAPNALPNVALKFAGVRKLWQDELLGETLASLSQTGKGFLLKVGFP